MSRAARFFAIVVCALSITTLFAPALRADVPQRTCGLPGLPGCPLAPPVIAGWTYTPDIGPYFFYTLDDFYNWYDGTYTPHNEWCSSAPTTTSQLSPDISEFGIVAAKYYRQFFHSVTYTYTIENSVSG